MAKTSSTFICQQCGYHSPAFLGKCPECGTWNSLVETIERASSSAKTTHKKAISDSKIVNTSDVEQRHFDRLSSGIDEFDRVLGGGIVKGSVVLVSGDPGIGKSTLLSQLALNINERSSSTTLYVSGEESAQQIKLRVDRIKNNANLAILNETDVDVACGVIEQIKPALVIVDSIQTLGSDDLSSVAGSVGQVRESAHRLQKVAKTGHIPVFLVGHVTKEGTIAGPKTLEHLVDVILSLEGDPTSQFRFLRSNKNRFGPTDEVGIFEMEEKGMMEVKNPSKLFLETKQNAPGSAVAALVTGLRPMLVEIQALVTKSNLPVPRRVATGIDLNRLQLLIAVLSKRLSLPLFDKDIFVNATGGIKVIEPAADLAICASIISSLKDQPLLKGTVFIGEVGLLGELRNVKNLNKRIAEAKKLNFTKIFSPENIASLTQLVSDLHLGSK